MSHKKSKNGKKPIPTGVANDQLGENTYPEFSAKVKSAGTNERRSK